LSSPLGSLLLSLRATGLPTTAVTFLFRRVAASPPFHFLFKGLLPVDPADLFSPNCKDCCQFLLLIPRFPLFCFFLAADSFFPQSPLKELTFFLLDLGMNNGLVYFISERRPLYSSIRIFRLQTLLLFETPGLQLFCGGVEEMPKTFSFFSSQKPPVFAFSLQTFNSVVPFFFPRRAERSFPPAR